MTRLRMKPSSTTSTTDEAILRATSRAQKSSRRKRRQPSESISPPRNPPPPIQDFDESSLPPSQAYKQTRTEEEEDQEFEERLKDASVQDQGVGYYENSLHAYASSYGGAAGIAAGLKSTGGGGLLDEEEYAEFVRAGMWRLKNKERLEWIGQQDKARKLEKERERLESESKRRDERDKRRKLEERNKRRLKEQEEDARNRYRDGWNKLQSLLPTTMELQFSDFQWPLFPPFALPPLSWPTIPDITLQVITDFLLPEELSKEERKGKLRSAVLSYHPDRFERFVLKVPEEKEEVRVRVRELGLRVSQVLNEISRGGGEK